MEEAYIGNARPLVIRERKMSREESLNSVVSHDEMSIHSARRPSLDWEVACKTNSTIPIPIKRPNLPTPNLVLPTVDGNTVSHSLLVDNLPIDSYGFILEERFGVTLQAYRAFERQYADKYDRQIQRWSALVPRVRGDLVVFPSINDQVKIAIRKGIPHELRPRAWYFYSGAQSRQEAEPKLYVELVKRDKFETNPQFSYQIENDISQTFTNNKRFRKMSITSPGFIEKYSHSQNDEEPLVISALRRILYAISLTFSAIGYSTGFNLIAATLLLITKDEQRSFWIMVCILEKLLPENYYSDSSFGCNVEQEVLTALLAWKLPTVYNKLQELQMSLHILTTTWFTNLFIDQLPFETLLRVWDCFLLEGSKVMLRVALSLFKLNQTHLCEIREHFELASFIRNLPKKQLDLVVLMDTAFNGVGGLSSSWIEKERDNAEPAWKAKMAVRRFSRISPAYCHAPIPTRGEGISISFVQRPILRMALADEEMPLFERPEEISLVDSSNVSVFLNSGVSNDSSSRNSTNSIYSK